LTPDDVKYMVGKLPGGSGIVIEPNAPHNWYLADDSSMGYMENGEHRYPIQEQLVAHGATMLRTDQSAGVDVLRSNFERLRNQKDTTLTRYKYGAACHAL
jgi:hypothetical protein